VAAPEPRLLVTRPAEAAARDVAALQALGVPAEALPLMAIEAAADTGGLRSAWEGLAGYALVMFVSGEAVRRFVAAGRGAAPVHASRGGAAGAGEPAAGSASVAAVPVRPASPVTLESSCATGRIDWPAGVRAAAPGPGTLRALLDAGVPPACCVAPADDAAAPDSDALWARLHSEDWRGRRVLVVAGEGGREGFENALLQAGARVDRLSVYRRAAPALDPAQRTRLAAARARPGQWVWQFSSQEAIAHLAQLAPGAEWSGAHALAPHPRIEAAARAAGFGAVHAVGLAPAATAAWWHGARAAVR
jgi:uroporphyrinogen-III synthase